MEKLQADLAAQEEDKIKKSEAVSAATSAYNALCAQKLASSENVVIPSPSCFANASFAAKCFELKALEATIVEADKAREEREEAMESSAGLSMEVDDLDLKESVDELLSKTPDQDKAAAKRALDDLVGLHAAKKGKKEFASASAGLVGAAVVSS